MNGNGAYTRHGNYTCGIQHITTRRLAHWHATRETLTRGTKVDHVEYVLLDATMMLVDQGELR